MTWTTLYRQGETSLSVRDAEWPPRKVEEVAASRLTELDCFLTRLQYAGEDGMILTLELLPDLIVGRNTTNPGQAPTYRVVAPRDIGGGHFATEAKNWPSLENATKDAREALRSYPEYVRSTASQLLRAGVDLQDMADQAMAASVMEE